MIKFNATTKGQMYEIEYDLNKSVELTSSEVAVKYSIKNLQAKIQLWSGHWEEIDTPKWAYRMAVEHLAGVLLKDPSEVVSR